jgi:hypothetical protein
MMLFWSNFAKDGKPGVSTNGINWDLYNHSEGYKNFMILDNKKNMKIQNSETTYKSLVEELNLDIRVSELERCVILYQMGTFVGNDILDKISKYADFSCKREDSRNFLEENASFISY